MKLRTLNKIFEIALKIDHDCELYQTEDGITILGDFNPLRYTSGKADKERLVNLGVSLISKNILKILI